MNQAQTQIFTKMVSIAGALPVSELKKKVVELFSDASEDGSVLFSTCLAALQKMLPESEFSDFCDSI
jgi:hypothetical protein